jgi:sigma-E factor negative regulatory protein RseC
MSGWIEERGVVVTVGPGWAKVRVERQSTCGSCQARSGCGNGVLAQVLGRRALELTIADPQGLAPGDRVTLGVRDQALVSGAFAMYLLPLAGLILPPALLAAGLPELGEGWAVLAGAAGFVLGLLLVRHWVRSRGAQFQPVLLAHEPAIR